MKAGMEIQNCASRTGARLGRTWTASTRGVFRPEARACNTKSELRRDELLAHIIRADAAQPRTPSRENVTTAESWGEIFNGNNARTASSRNNQGRERKRSVVHIASRWIRPPRKPAAPPMQAASKVDISA